MKKKKKKSLLIRVLFVFLLVILLPLLILEKVISSVVARIKYKKWQNKTYSAQDFIESAEIEYVDVMEGYVFEQFLKTLFFYLGFDAIVTKKSGDYGADLLLKKDNSKIVVQAKRYNKNVGSKAVQEVVVAKNHYKADDAIVITNSFFTKQAEEIAEENDVTLVDRNELVALIKEAKEKIEEDYNLSIEETNSIRENFGNQFKFKI